MILTDAFPAAPHPVTTEPELIAQFESGSLPPSAFRHADHVHMAFAYLRQYPVLEALERFSIALQRFAQLHGKPNLYHQTITWAYVFLIHERIVRAGHPQDWEEFVQAHPDLLTWKNGILTKYYAEETLQSNLARREFLFPDKLA
jgi:hypothetical protein